MTLYPYRELTITSKVQECCGREFAAKLGEFGYGVNSPRDSDTDPANITVTKFSPSKINKVIE